MNFLPKLTERGGQGGLGLNFPGGKPLKVPGHFGYLQIKPPQIPLNMCKNVLPFHLAQQLPGMKPHLLQSVQRLLRLQLSG